MRFDKLNAFTEQMNTSLHPFYNSSDVVINRPKDETIATSWEKSNQLSILSDEKFFFPMGFRPRNTDVILERGVNSYNHIGNEMLRNMVASRLDEYAATRCRKGKSDVLSSIVAQVHKQGGAFIKKDRKTGLWGNAEPHLVRNKISQTFRKALQENKNIIRKKQHKQLRIQYAKMLKQDGASKIIVADILEPFTISQMESKNQMRSLKRANSSESIISLDHVSLSEGNVLDDFYETHSALLYDEAFDHGGDQYENLFD